MQKNMMVNGIITVLWEKWVEFLFEWKKITASALVSPMLYMIALGWGLGSTSSVTDRPYIDFPRYHCAEHHEQQLFCGWTTP